MRQQLRRRLEDVTFAVVSVAMCVVVAAVSVIAVRLAWLIVTGF